MQHGELTEKVIGCAYEVYNRMGFGFLESVYETCLGIELPRAGIPFETQQSITVFYDDEVAGKFFADMIIDGKVIVELKSVRQIAKAHESQLAMWLCAIGLSRHSKHSVSPEWKLMIVLGY